MSSVKFGSMTRVIGNSKVLSRGYSTTYESVPKTKVKTARLMGMLNADLQKFAVVKYHLNTTNLGARKNIIF